ncbi:MAG: hypothetical protein PUB19_07305 [Lachnospiraceae bacterium]|nr:hypothetical protein [Lachnospiraceae bacterium]
MVHIYVVSTYAETYGAREGAPDTDRRAIAECSTSKQDIFIESITTVFLRFDSVCLDSSPDVDVND